LPKRHMLHTLAWQKTRWSRWCGSSIQAWLDWVMFWKVTDIRYGQKKDHLMAGEGQSCQRNGWHSRPPRHGRPCTGFCEPI
jgi:hypothetical protein